MNDLVQVIFDEPQSGLWNMAVDEALLEESLQSGTIFLRLYRWSEPTVSLGYFQNEMEQRRDPRLTKLPTVRRLSGGGAILHHHEQTYSCSLPPTHRLAQQPTRLYEEIHAVFVSWLTECGVPVKSRGENSDRKDEPFLCFLREAAPDLIVSGQKILGSAQRRRRGAVLQHGSLLLEASEHVPELRGLHDCFPIFPDKRETWKQVALRLAHCLGRPGLIGELSEPVRTRATMLLSNPVMIDRLIAQA